VGLGHQVCKAGIRQHHGHSFLDEEHRIMPLPD
jgi:hypothetical protein